MGMRPVKMLQRGVQDAQNTEILLIHWEKTIEAHFDRTGTLKK